MKYQEYLDCVGEVITEPGERLKWLAAHRSFFAGTQKQHACGDEYIVELSDDGCKCLKCGTLFIKIDDDA